MNNIPTLPLLRALALALVLTLTTAVLHAQVPGILNYQGRVAVGDPPVNFEGSGAFKFALVNADGTTSYWSNDGTSTGGSQPTAAVTLTVAKGLYSVLLGDTSLTNMTAIPASAFANDDVRLRVWFDDGTNGSQLLTPDQRIAAVGYAMVAGTAGVAQSVADGAVTSVMIAAGAVGSSQLADGLTLGGTTTGTFSGPLTGNVTGTTLTATGTIVLPVTTGPAQGVITQGGSRLLHTFGTENFFAGANAGNLTMTGGANTGLGEDALASNTTGGENTAIGLEALLANTTGSGNIAVGHGAGSLLSTGDGNIAIGHAGVAGESDIIRIGTSQTTAHIAGVITGNGGGLTNIPASAVTGTIPSSQVATPPPGMVLIPAGVFTMGNSVAADTDITNAAPVSTTVSAFYMDVNEVTLSQWQSVYYWAADNGYTDLPAGTGKGPNHPVQTVTWYDCAKWCNARSEQAGKTPVYYTDGAQTTIYKTGNVDLAIAQVKWSATGYRLPTEAEWEKAVRGGRSGQRFPWGNTITQNLANYLGNTGTTYDLGPNGLNAIGSVGGTNPATSPVGSFAANGYGLNDMAGNVMEWCWDRYGTPYAGGTDPQGDDTGSNRVFRGGHWNNSSPLLRCADRQFNNPTLILHRLGFRTVLAPGQ
jgi:formylglycine-generating enzyme required for sulfatase activity